MTTSIYTFIAQTNSGECSFGATHVAYVCVYVCMCALAVVFWWLALCSIQFHCSLGMGIRMEISILFGE